MVPSKSVRLKFCLSALAFALPGLGAVAAEEAKAPRAEGRERAGGKSGGSRGAGGQRQPVEVVSIARRDLSESLRVVGSLAANETATIRPEMSGLIRSIHFEEGRAVQRGDLLVKIEDSELQAQVAQAQSRHELARLNLERAQNLRQTQSNTQSDADRASSEFTATRAELELLKVRLARTEVRAPFDGVVEARTLSPGDYVNTQSAITTLNDLSRLKVDFQIPERHVGKVRRGTKFSVQATSAAGAEAAVPGEVYFVSAVIDRNTRSSEVKGYLGGPPSEVKAGMFVVIEIVLEVRKGALTVPEGAVFADQRGAQLVTVAEAGGEKVAKFVPVRLGLRSRGIVEVTPVRGELSEQVQVVAAGVGSLALFDGAKLEPRPLRAEFLSRD